MKDFSNASFPPDTIEVMTLAMNAALATLPHPVSSKYVQLVAETILRTAKDGERDPKALERMALLELKISPGLLVVAVTQNLRSHLPTEHQAQSTSANCGVSAGYCGQTKRTKVDRYAKIFLRHGGRCSVQRQDWYRIQNEC
jgi:hypothetical protein